MIQEADTVGVFQIESRAQMSMLPRLKPRTFYDLVVEVAIVRPGPIQGNMVHPYLRRRKGEEPVCYPLPELKSVLERTYGVPLFQEQVMKLAMVAGGFTAGEADSLRRAMGTWRSSGRLEGLLDKLMVRMEKRGISHDYALQIANQIKGFGEYGFPESHAASFALLAYASSYIKCHYPAPFTAALLNSQPMGFYSPATLVEDARRHGVKVHSMDVNHSQWESSVVVEGCQPPASSLQPSASIRLGLSLVKGLREDEAVDLLNIRQEHGLFRSFEQLFERTRLSVAALLKLALAGTFSSLNVERREALWQVLHACKNRDTLFHGAPVSPALAQSQPMTPFEVVMADLDATRTFHSLHPFELVYPVLKKRREFTTAARLKDTRHQSRVVVGGLAVVKQRPPTAGGVLFLTLEDHTGLMNLVVHRRVRQRYQRVLLEEPILLAHGTLEKVDGVINIMVNKLQGIRLLEKKKRFQARDFR
jgi:error-prone DNA polymerase